MQVLIDTTARHAQKVILTLVVATLGSLWTVFVRPQLVMAGDLQQVVDSVEQLKQKAAMRVDIEQLTDSVKQLEHGFLQQQSDMRLLAESVLDARADYHQDQIRLLESARASAPLNSEQEYRLRRHKDDLERIQTRRSAIIQ